ncbi:phosphonoacetaldehyde reductase [archaeon]|jgi:alcohol dehydrogenase|nr:phosphonoacetaldehyde reductase [archaeon]MBT6761815.1 phosphonoacetaldehyde reductase [archaeon]
MVVEQIIYTGIEQIQSILESALVKDVFLVTGNRSYELSGAKEQLETLLSDYNVTEFSDFEKNPKVEDLRRGIEKYRNSNSNIVLAVGGGSVLDMGKSIALLAGQSLDPEEYITKRSAIVGESVPLIAVPTTSGSGSEATHFAVVYINKQKYSLAHQSMLPKYVVLDSKLTESLPVSITASTTMDAFSQGMESYWSVASTDESKSYAKGALELIMKHGVANVNNPNSETRAAIQIAANLAGKAINISKTTACHAISYTFTSYFGIPHGHAVGLTLASLFEYNAAVSLDDCNDPRGSEYVQGVFSDLRNFLGVNSSAEAVSKINSLMTDMGLETSLSVLGIGDCSEIAVKNVNLERLGNNPRKIGAEEIKEVILGIQ